MHDTNLLEDQPIAWAPTPDVIERAQLTKFMLQVGVSTWDELYKFSIDDVEKFTEEVLKFLDIKFDPPYEKLLDLSNGPEFPNWFPRNADGRNADAPFRNEGNVRTSAATFENKKGWHERGYLRHFDGVVTQFVTFRLADSLPQTVLRRLAAEIDRDKPSDPSREFRLRVEEHLDRGMGECILKQPEIAGLVEETILKEDGKTCRLIAWVIMPNHVHLLLRPLEGCSLSDIMQSIKSISSHKINKAMGRKGSVWQPDVFDRYIRDADHFGKTLRYIEHNPVKAGLCSSQEEWRFSSASPAAGTRTPSSAMGAEHEQHLPPEEPAIAGTRTPPSAMSAEHEQDLSPEEPAIADEGVRVPTAGLNITEMCLDRWQTDEMKNQPAVIWEGEEGKTEAINYLELLHAVADCAAGLRANGIDKRKAVGIHLPMSIETVIALLALGRIGAIAVPVFSGYGVSAIESRLNAVGAVALFTSTGFPRRGKLFDSKEIALQAVANVPTIKKVFTIDREEKHWREEKTFYDPDFAQLNEQINVSWQDLCNLCLSDNYYHLEPTSPEDPLIILYTSGTTGKPKGIAHTHASFPIKAAQDMAFGTDVGKGTRICWYTDIGWMMGPWLIYGALINGATICLYDGAPDYPTPDRMWEFCAKHKVEVLGISPTLVRSLAAAEKSGTPTPSSAMSAEHEQAPSPEEPAIAGTRTPSSAMSAEHEQPLSPEEPAIADEGVRVPPHQRHDLSSLRMFASTGEPWNPAPWWWLFKQVGNSKLPIINYSGGTEISGGILMGNPLLPQKPCSFPAPCPGMDVDILDENGESVKPGEVGELVIKQPWIGMARGFWNEPARYLETYWSRFKNIWVHGDFAMRDKDGHWFILGRSDDTLKVAGKRVGPAEVESLLVAHPLVTEAAVIGVPDEVKGTAMVAFCVVAARDEGGRMKDETESSGSSLIRHPSSLEADLRALVAKDMGKPLAPSKIHFVSALPKTRNAKIMRRVLRSAYLGEDPGDLSALENLQAVDDIRKLPKV